MKEQHYFIGIRIPVSISQPSVDFITLHENDFPFRVWTNVYDYHITLAFLGAVHDEKIKELKKELSMLVKRHHSFVLQIGKLNLFGINERPRVVYLEVSRQQPLLALQKEIYDLCIKLGFSLDKRPYHPHVTIAKRWDGQQPFSHETYVNQPILSKQESWIEVNEVIVFTINTKDIPKYIAVERCPLL
ncbi:RNA 2',3'-cyclic phosphodiesterase [Metabacillus iocasae]|uniref:RNA 2',3'-cyclic phosphodiesterase n=1 Tax=Priestia iocasae TaxID=2291674 RepID=A0ABS2QZM4_9BACI|nr:RNA 2',3'-cyclic phosphodiesterase [Metabacillus iocasae]MBM7704867.1 2'-5' RNA ligase [Metabacillus iocasae]